MSNVAKVLNAAADLIEKPGAWTQFAFARHVNGNLIGPLENNATCWCVSGAIQRVDAGPYSAAWEAFNDYIRRRYRVEHMAQFNDAPGRTQAEVVAALREAAQRAAA